MNTIKNQELKEVYAYCLRLTRDHYENFPVASRVVPAKYRPHIAAIYAFARTADDFSDEEHDREKILDWREQLYACVKSKSENPIFIALSNTIREFNLPLQWLDDLLTAFLWDLDKNRYKDFDELQQYCHFSANPVGRIILWLFGYRDDQLMDYSDSITTALQLTNFWQDLSIDLPKDRVYIPRSHLKKHGIGTADLFEKKAGTSFPTLLRQLVEETRSFYTRGLPLLNFVRGRLYWELKLTIFGGLTVLNKVYSTGPDILEKRPALKKAEWGKIALKAMVGKNMTI